MNDEFTTKGGGAIGNWRATYPFAKLTITREKLQITLSLAGTVVFRPSDIVRIDTELSSFGLQRSIRVFHKVDNYSSEIIFKPVRSVGYIIGEIERTGFLSNSNSLSQSTEEKIRMLQASGSYPLKKNITIAVVVCWNLLFLPVILSNTKWRIRFGFPEAMIYPLVFMLSFCLSLLLFKPIQRIALKKGHHINELSTGLIFINIISCFLILIICSLSS